MQLVDLGLAERLGARQYPYVLGLSWRGRVKLLATVYERIAGVIGGVDVVVGVDALRRVIARRVEGNVQLVRLRRVHHYGMSIARRKGLIISLPLINKHLIIYESRASIKKKTD